VGIPNHLGTQRVPFDVRQPMEHLHVHRGVPADGLDLGNTHWSTMYPYRFSQPTNDCTRIFHFAFFTSLRILYCEGKSSCVPDHAPLRPAETFVA